MANVLKEEKKQQVLALGRLGWSLRRIQQTTRIRRETASAYLKAAGIGVRPPSGWGRRAAKPANQVITDSGAAKPAIPVISDSPNPNPENLSNKGKAKATSKPANEVITDSAVIADLNTSQRDEVALLPRRQDGDRLHLRSPVRAPALASRTGRPSSWGSAEAGMRGPSGKTWSASTASPAATKACSGSCASGAEPKCPKPAW